MTKLDIIRLHTGLQQDFGLDAGYLSNVSTTSSTYLLAPNGLPMHVGWFDNSKKSAQGVDVYALTTHPEQPRNMHHRIMVEHGRSGTATLTEEDSADYLEGYDDHAHTFRRESLGQPDLDRVIRELTVGAYVLNASIGGAHEKFAWSNDYDVPAVRDHGLEIISAGDVLEVIDQATQDRYAQISPPVLH